MSELIERQAVIDLWNKYHPTIAVDAMQYDAELRQLPHAQPEPCEDGTLWITLESWWNISYDDPIYQDEFEKLKAFLEGDVE